MKKTNTYLPVIDTLRGLAALMVCVYHFVSMTINYFPVDIQNSFTFGKYGVHVFFVISGVVIPLSMLKDGYTYNKFSKFFGKRLWRIEPPYFVSIILFLIFATVRNFIPGVNPTDLSPGFLNIVLHIGYLIPFFKNEPWMLGVYWTLAIEFQYYLLLSLVYPLIMKGISYRVVIFGAVLLLSLLIKSTGFLFYWFPLFLIGIYWVLNRTKVVGKLEFWIALMCCVFFHGIIRSWVDVLFGIGTISVIQFMPFFVSKVGKFLGRISYSVYLLHTLVGATFINFMTRYDIPLFGKFGVVLVAILLTIFCSNIFYKLIEKPSQKRSKSISL